VRLCPWADVVYACDGQWWKNKNGLPDFKGTKLAHDTGVCAIYRDVHKIEVVDHDRMLFDDPGVVGSGGNSGFQALNIAIQFGAPRILLIGFDMHAAGGVHWHGLHRNGLHNPADHNFVRWRRSFAEVACRLSAMGIDIVNASPVSALCCFRQETIEQTLLDWNL
jgi:hypothetical protein